MEGKVIIFKEVRDPQRGPFVSVSRVLIWGGAQNLLQIRLFNRGDCIVTAVGVSIYPTEQAGEGKACRKYFFELCANPNSEFALPDICLSTSWDNVRVEVEYVRSFDREFHFQGEKNMKYLGRPTHFAFKDIKRLSNPLKKYAVILFFLVFLSASLTLLSCWRAGWMKRETETMKNGLSKETEIEIHAEI